MLSKELLEILACPKCKGALVWNKEKNALDCTSCNLRFPITNGIPELLLDRAQPIDEEPRGG